jgi:selenocysteine lyase/cysteine desulfurase
MRREKPLVYADYTASGRGLTFIEDYIRQQVLPYYANTHTETSFTGAQTTAFREQAREEIRKAVNGKERDKIIFCGPGATAAINKLIDILGMRLPRDLSARYDLESHIPADERPVVFIVVSLLNDLFGIQVRGGCSCAGPYGHTLLGMDMEYSRARQENWLAGSYRHS